MILEFLEAIEANFFSIFGHVNFDHIYKMEFHYKFPSIINNVWEDTLRILKSSILR